MINENEFKITEIHTHTHQCLQNYIATSAFADVSYSMADVEATFLYKIVLNISQIAIIGRCWWI